MTHADQWRDEIAAFLTNQVAGAARQSSIYAYRQRLEHLARRVEVGPWDLTAEQLVAYAAAQTWVAETRRGRRNTFLSFWRWGVLTGRTKVCIADALPHVAATPPNPNPIPPRAYNEALMAASEREMLMLHLSYDLGMRRGEVAQASREDLMDTFAGWSILVHGKGGKKRIVPVGDKLAAMIRACPPGALFPGRIDGHLSDRYVGKLVRRVLPDEWTMHKLRHGFAARAHRESHDLSAVQDLLGHASPATTRVYVPRDDEAMRQIVNAIAS